MLVHYGYIVSHISDCFVASAGNPRVYIIIKKRRITNCIGNENTKPAHRQTISLSDELEDKWLNNYNNYKCIHLIVNIHIHLIVNVHRRAGQIFG